MSRRLYLCLWPRRAGFNGANRPPFLFYHAHLLMTGTQTIATKSTYTDILAQNHESYLQLRRQQRTILGLARTPRVRRRDQSWVAPTLSKRFKTRYVPFTKLMLIHNMLPRAGLGKTRLHQAFSAPLHGSRLNGRPRPRSIEHKHVFRYKTLRAKKRPSELLPRPPTRGTMPAQGLSKPALKITVSSSSVAIPDLSCTPVAVPEFATSPVDPVALCISNLQADRAENVTVVGVAVNSHETSPGGLLSYAEYWLETSKAEFKKLKEPLKKQTAALENVAHKMVRPTSSGYRKVRGYMQRDSHKPHLPHMFSAVFRTSAPKMQTLEPRQPPEEPHAPPATGASSGQLCMVQSSRNVPPMPKIDEVSSGCATEHGALDDCVVCQFLEHATLQTREVPDVRLGLASMDESLVTKSAPGRLMVGLDASRLPQTMLGASVTMLDSLVLPREAGILLIQQALEYLKSTGNINDALVSRRSELDVYVKASAIQHTSVSGGLVRRGSTASIVSSKHSVVHEPALGMLIRMLFETLQNLPNTPPNAEGSGNIYSGNSGTGNVSCGNDRCEGNAPRTQGPGKVNVGKASVGNSEQAGSDSSSSLEKASETNPEANFNNQVVPSIFGRNYLVLSPILSFEGTFIDTAKPVDNECGFLELRTGPTRLLKQVRFIVDEEFNAQETLVTWLPQPDGNTLGLIGASGLLGYLMELGGSDETLVLQSAEANQHDGAEDHDNFSEFGYQMLATGNFAFASDELLDSGYFTARSSKASLCS